MKVLKFGGTSVSDYKSIDCVTSIITSCKSQITVIVSALGGVTNILNTMLEKAGNGDLDYKDQIDELEKRHIDIIKKRIPIIKQSSITSFIKTQLIDLENFLDSVYSLKEITTKSSARILNYGEILSSYIIFEILKNKKNDIIYGDSKSLIKTNRINKKDVVNFDMTKKKILDFYKSNTTRIKIFPGFISSNEKGEPTNLGRGGSDYTAAILANILDAKILEIWTDVSGMFTANPKLVKQAIPIAKMSYYEAMEMSHFGAKVLFTPTLKPIIDKNIPIVIKNTFKPNDLGTEITTKNYNEKQIVKGISHIDNISLLTIEGSGMVGVPGFSKRVFEAISKNYINIIMITQASSEYSICLGLKTEDAETARNAIDKEFSFEISHGKINPTKVETRMVNIAIVGDKMKDHQGISGKLFSSLGINNINIRAIAQGASERNISIIIDKHNLNKALNTLHETFFESQIKELNLFIMGVGNVGRKLLEQIKKQEKYLVTNLNLRVQIIGISNSTRMILSETPIDIAKWDHLIKNGDKANSKVFFDFIKSKNLRNSIFIDNTASQIIAKEYLKYLRNNIGIVTCNKIACADKLKNYKKLKVISRKYNSPFLFETNVGAGLPIIDTLNNLISSGDKIIKIEAILSGSLNYIFNNFKKEKRFIDIVKKAEDLGYTEPDPKIDLSGIDVARKILILARESGQNIELSDVKNNSFLPIDSLKTTSKEEFYKSLKNNSDHFNEILYEAKKHKSKLKYVAKFENGIASVGLHKINRNHDFYNIEDSDNIVLFYTNRYSKNPLIVKGAGAGAEVTAAGIFADIIKIGKN